MLFYVVWILIELISKIEFLGCSQKFISFIIDLLHSQVKNTEANYYYFKKAVPISTCKKILKIGREKIIKEATELKEELS